MVHETDDLSVLPHPMMQAFRIIEVLLHSAVFALHTYLLVFAVVAETTGSGYDFLFQYTPLTAVCKSFSATESGHALVRNVRHRAHYTEKTSPFKIFCKEKLFLYFICYKNLTALYEYSLLS